MNRLSALRRSGAALLLALALLTALTTSATAKATRAAGADERLRGRLADRGLPEVRRRARSTTSPAATRSPRRSASARPADLFAAASPDAPQALFQAGLVEQPVTFATNKLVLAVPIANPANITSIYDLERPGVKLDIGTPTVPIGAYTRQVLGYLGITNAVMPQVVSQEQDVKAIAAKVALGTADAGLHVRDRRPRGRRHRSS